MKLFAHDHEFIDISAGSYAASISVFGGGPRALEFDGGPLLTDYPKGFNPPLSAGTLLAPWPNRVADGVYIFDGQVHRLDITEPSRANAIHGFVADSIWRVADRSDAHVSLAISLDVQPGWPWPMEMTICWRVDAELGLTAEFTAENRGECDCPFGFGWHPYPSAFGAQLRDCTLQLPVVSNLPLEPIRNLPAGPAIAAESILPNVQEGTSLDGVWLDHCFVVGQGSSAPANGRREARLIGPGGNGVALWADSSFNYFQVYIADPGRREGFPGHDKAIAVEPMTCPPDALRSGTGLVRLAPGESRRWSMGLKAVIGES